MKSPQFYDNRNFILLKDRGARHFFYKTIIDQVEKIKQEAKLYGGRKPKNFSLTEKNIDSFTAKISYSQASVLIDSKNLSKIEFVLSELEKAKSKTLITTFIIVSLGSNEMYATYDHIKTYRQIQSLSQFYNVTLVDLISNKLLPGHRSKSEILDSIIKPAHQDERNFDETNTLATHPPLLKGKSNEKTTCSSLETCSTGGFNACHPELLPKMLDILNFYDAVDKTVSPDRRFSRTDACGHNLPSVHHDFTYSTFCDPNSEHHCCSPDEITDTFHNGIQDQDLNAHCISDQNCTQGITFQDFKYPEVCEYVPVNGILRYTDGEDFANLFKNSSILILGDSHARMMYQTLAQMITGDYSFGSIVLPGQMSNCFGGYGYFSTRACQVAILPSFSKYGITVTYHEFTNKINRDTISHLISNETYLFIDSGNHLDYDYHTTYNRILSKFDDRNRYMFITPPVASFLKPTKYIKTQSPQKSRIFAAEMKLILDREKPKWKFFDLVSFTEKLYHFDGVHVRFQVYRAFWTIIANNFSEI